MNIIPYYDVTYKIIHHRPFKAPNEQWIRDFLSEENGVEIINIEKIMEDSVMYDLKNIHEED